MIYLKGQEYYYECAEDNNNLILLKQLSLSKKTIIPIYFILHKDLFNESGFKRVTKKQYDQCLLQIL